MTQGKAEFVNVHNEYYESAVKGSKFRGKVLYHSFNNVDLGMLLYGMGFRIKGGKLEGKVMLMGRFKYSDRRFGRVRFSLVKGEYVNVLNEFIKKYNPLDFNEEW
jgi:CRISPR-associated protein